MAEATLTTETEVTPPNDEVLETPNPAPEAESPPENQEEEFESPFSDEDILKEAGLGEAVDGTGDAAGTPADGKVPSEWEGLPPEEIERKVNERADAIANAKLTNAQTVNYYEGLRKYVADAVKEADRLADQGSGYLEREWVKNTINAIKGDYEILKDYDVQVAQKAALDAGAKHVGNLYGQATVANLGQKAAEELFKAGHSDPKTFLEAYGEAYAKTKGYVPASKLADANTKGFRNAEAKYIQVLKNHGISVASTGPDLKQPTNGTGIRQGTKEWAENAPIEQLIADRARRQGAA